MVRIVQVQLDSQGFLQRPATPGDDARQSLAKRRLRPTSRTASTRARVIGVGLPVKAWKRAVASGGKPSLSSTARSPWSNRLCAKCYGWRSL